MNPADTIAIMLLVLFGIAIGIGSTVVWLAIRWNRKLAAFPGPYARRIAHERDSRRVKLLQGRRPTIWLAIRSRDPIEILDAFSLNDPTPCSWSDGLNSDHELFIAPPLRGWILVVGNAIPDPETDVDLCFRFLQNLSRKLGQVQLFQADHTSNQHAWIRVENGRVIRAYAWAGSTLWNQGVKTRAEIELGLKCFAYGENVTAMRWQISELLAANTEKVPLVAARWSLDPVELEQHLLPGVRGIAGNPSDRFEP